MSDENKAVLRRFYDEFFTGGNLDVATRSSLLIAPSTSVACSWELVLKLSSKLAP